MRPRTQGDQSVILNYNVLLVLKLPQRGHVEILASLVLIYV